MTPTDDLELRLRQPAVFSEPAEGQRCRLVMAEAADEIARLRAENEALREALEPFAACMEYINDDEDGEEWAKFRLLIKDYRRARTALEGSRHE
jgi:hypothetical protein